MSHIYPQDWKYGIIDSVDLPNVDFNEDIYPKNANSLRYSLDSSQFVIKWEEDHTPHFIEDGTVVPASILSWADCLTLMQTPAWSEPEPVEE
jgi:hypothetical protein